MHLGLVGLGRMGLGLAQRLLRAGHTVSGYDRSDAARAELAAHGGLPATSLAELVAQAPEHPRVVWVMVPAGPPVDGVLDELRPLLHPGDVLIEGGNSHYPDSMRRAAALADAGFHYLDVGVSGGVWGLTEGFALMVGGTPEAVHLARPLFEAVAPAPTQGWAHVGPSGAGHFVKMVHNGIEYGLMQAYAEGFALMKAKTEFNLDLHTVAETWRVGSVVRSWLLDLTARALAPDAALADVAPYVSDSGMGRWTAQEAINLGVSTPVLTHALYTRFASRDAEGYAERLLAALRNQFGGHAVKKDEGA